MGHGLALAGFGCRFACRHVLQELSFSRVGKIQISPAAVAQTNVASLHEGINCSDRQLHMTARANLVAYDRYSLFPSRHQSVVMGKDLCRDLCPQLSHTTFNVLFLYFAEF